jgi:hypothetical protein
MTRDLRRRAVRTGGVLALLMGLLSVTVDSPAKGEKEPKMTESQASVAELAARMQIVLPSGATIAHVANEPGREQSIKLILTVDKAYLDRFLVANDLRPANFNAASHGFLGADQGGWDPRSGSPFPVHARGVMKGEYLYIGYRTTGDNIRIYLMWFQT